MCKSSVHNYLKTKRQPLLTEKQCKNRHRLQRNTKICLKKNGKTMCLATDHQCIYFMNKIEKNDIVWGSQEAKVPLAKTVKKSAYVNIWGGGGQYQQVDFQQSILCPRDKRSTRSIMLKTFWRSKLSPF